VPPHSPWHFGALLSPACWNEGDENWPSFAMVCGNSSTPRPRVEINCPRFCYCHERWKLHHIRFRQPFSLIILFLCDLNVTCRFPFRLNRFLQTAVRITVARHPACDIAVAKPLLDISPYIFSGVELGLVQSKQLTICPSALKPSSGYWRVLSPLLDEMRCTFLILDIVLHCLRILP
jgi:hypothetical protein